jgi:hypothetical protein
MPGTDVVARAAVASTTASNAGLPRWVLWAALIVIVVLRLLWFLDYLRLGRHNLADAFMLPTSRLYTTTSERERQKIHESVATETDRLVETCLLAGTIAFAAWTALFAVANQAPGSEISSTTRSLLLVGAAALVAAPLLFRVPDLHTTYIGRRSALFIGLTAVGLALASLAEDLLGKVPGTVVTLAAVVVLVLRDVVDTIGEIGLQRSAVGHALAAPPSGAIEQHPAGLDQVRTEAHSRLMEVATQVDTALREAQDAATRAERAEQDAQAAAERAREEAETRIAAAEASRDQARADASRYQAAAEAAEQRAAASEAQADTAGRDAQAPDEAAKGDAE